MEQPVLGSPVQISKYAGEQLLEVASYYNGQRHGTCITYRPDGKPKQISTFWQGHLHGPLYEFWPSGLLALEATYVYGILDTRAEYNEIGQRIGPALKSILLANPKKNDTIRLRTTLYTSK